MTGISRIKAHEYLLRHVCYEEDPNPYINLFVYDDIKTRRTLSDWEYRQIMPVLNLMEGHPIHGTNNRLVDYVLTKEEFEAIMTGAT